VSRPNSDLEIDDIARDLERYVAMHPAAADTVSGIARWWLRRPVEPPITHVEAAVDVLVHRGVLSRRVLPDGKFVYARGSRTSGI
jgi:hypothetical protein